MTTQQPPVLTLLDAWSGGQGAPALTWYGPDGERVELSQRVLANWVIKAMNLLTDEADVTPGTVVTLDLPMHWRTLVWALAAWGCGATVTLPGEPAAETAEVLVSAADQPATAPLVIAIALPALARQVSDLPAGAIDGAAELMAQPDVLINPPDWDPLAVALGSLRHAELADLPAAGLPAGGRYLVPAGSVGEGLRTCLGLWTRQGSVVLVGDPEADLDRIGAQEGAHRLP